MARDAHEESTETRRQLGGGLGTGAGALAGGVAVVLWRGGELGRHLIDHARGALERAARAGAPLDAGSSGGASEMQAAARELVAGLWGAMGPVLLGVLAGALATGWLAHRWGRPGGPSRGTDRRGVRVLVRWTAALVLLGLLWHHLAQVLPLLSRAPASGVTQTWALSARAAVLGVVGVVALAGLAELWLARAAPPEPRRPPGRGRLW